jgi:hypothetical protein
MKLTRGIPDGSETSRRQRTFRVLRQVLKRFARCSGLLHGYLFVLQDLRVLIRRQLPPLDEFLRLRLSAFAFYERWTTSFLV